MIDDALRHRYAAEGSQDAFVELVRRLRPESGDTRHPSRRARYAARSRNPSTSDLRLPQHLVQHRRPPARAARMIPRPTPRSATRFHASLPISTASPLCPPPRSLSKRKSGSTLSANSSPVAPHKNRAEFNNEHIQVAFVALDYLGNNPPMAYIFYPADAIRPLFPRPKTE
jgi:hypothetical protein